MSPAEDEGPGSEERIQHRHGLVVNQPAQYRQSEKQGGEQYPGGDADPPGQ
jgi:hypothetical protein